MVRGEFPAVRMRRTRQHEFTRHLVREHQLSAADLIYPVFIHAEQTARENIASMPGVDRLSLNELLKTVEACAELKIPALALFPVIEPSKKSSDAKEAYNPKGLIPQTIQAIKKRFPDIGLITDIALDPYTSHGQDGLIDAQGRILNDETIEVLCRQALCHSEAGADILAPSDMMDGRIGRIRQALDEKKFENTCILSYAAKYASSFYGPFRDAVGSSAALGKSNKFSYQMDPANRLEALHEVALDLKEGADFVMVKPGLPYLDIIRDIKDRFAVPTFAYQVSGEYSMLVAAAQNGWLDLDACLLEVFYSFRRAGADAVFTYFAPKIAKLLQSN